MAGSARGYVLVKKIQTDAIKEVGKLSPLLYDLQTHFLQIIALNNIESPSKEDRDQISIVSKHALNIVDHALFASQALQLKLPLTSISSAAIAQDVALSLNSLAKAYDVDFDTDITKRLEPIYSNERAVRGILYGIAASLITAGPVSQKRKNRIIIAAQETAPNIQRLGVYSPDINIYPSTVKNTSKFISTARSVSPAEFHHSGLGLIVSDYLCRSLGISLKRFEHRGQKGIGFYVSASNQLALIK